MRLFIKNRQYINFTFLSFLFFLPTQLDKFYFFSFSYIGGVRIDYLAPALYFTDILFVLIMISTRHKIWPKLYKFKEYARPFHFVFLILVLINIFISVTTFVAIYRWIKVTEAIVIFYIFKNIHIDKKQILQALLFSSALQLFLAISQIVNHKSIQGIWYLLGERYFTIGTPGIAKVALNGVEILRAYGTFSHPNSLAGYYLLLYGFVLFGNHSKKRLY